MVGPVQLLSTLAWMLAAGPVGAPAAPVPRGVPAMVFVARSPLGDRGPATIPGLGPRQRARVTAGRLLLRRMDGAIVDLLPGTPLRDVSGPAVAPGGRIAFAATPHPDSAWRLYVLPAVAAGTPTPLPIPAASGEHYDDLDPCWLDDSTLVFCSTRGGRRSQYDGSPVAQLWRIDFGSNVLRRLTAERNGVEGPAFDARTGRLAYSRWWFNRWRPAREAAARPTLDASQAMRPDTINLWQPMSIAPDGSDPHVLIAPGRERRDGSLVQVAFGAGGEIFGVTADVLGLSPVSGATAVAVHRGRNSAARHVAGAAFLPEHASGYGTPRGLAAPSACAPAPLRDGRVVFSLDPGGRGDFGLWIAKADGSARERLVDLPGTLELDAAVVPPRASRRVPIATSVAAAFPADAPRTPAELERWPHRFRFLDRNVFGGGFGSGAARDARNRGPLSIRFWAALPRPDDASGDTLVLVREALLGKTGRVDEPGLPALVPMFEQLVDAKGVVLMSAHGPAHVAGFNVGVPGGTTTCIGCHRGHSLR